MRIEPDRDRDRRSRNERSRAAPRLNGADAFMAQSGVGLQPTLSWSAPATGRTDLVHGDTVTEVLDYVQFRASDLLATFRRKVANATGIQRQEANMFIADYVAGLEGYTYLEGEAAR